MTSSQPNLLELAKHGDARAITVLLNRSLQPRGISAKAGLKDSCLQIFLESVQVPEQQILVPLIQRGIENIGIQSIRTVKVYGRVRGADSPSWIDEFQLAGDDFLVDFVPDSIDSFPTSSII